VRRREPGSWLQLALSVSEREEDSSNLHMARLMAKLTKPTRLLLTHAFVEGHLSILGRCI
jgi:hypothetical protein